MRSGADERNYEKQVGDLADEAFDAHLREVEGRQFAGRCEVRREDLVDDKDHADDAEEEKMAIAENTRVPVAIDSSEEDTEQQQPQEVVQGEATFAFEHTEVANEEGGGQGQDAQLRASDHHQAADGRQEQGEGCYALTLGCYHQATNEEDGSSQPPDQRAENPESLTQEFAASDGHFTSCWPGSPARSRGADSTPLPEGWPRPPASPGWPAGRRWC